MNNDVQESLTYLFSMEPGATVERAVERVNGPLSEEEIRTACAELVAAGRLKVNGAGWEYIPPPNQVDVARDALAQIEGMAGPASAVAKGALDKIGRRGPH